MGISKRWKGWEKGTMEREMKERKESEWEAAGYYNQWWRV